uniref:Uncharacterized protein n=1 Tax=virus sp. ctuWX8 TaxID=2826816 RepID=A0A8S5R865_9VIRU|nr:MAG TPA: hypothetical protein [virus sp. ctuWX8]
MKGRFCNACHRCGLYRPHVPHKLNLVFFLDFSSYLFILKTMYTKLCILILFDGY